MSTLVNVTRQRSLTAFPTLSTLDCFDEIMFRVARLYGVPPEALIPFALDLTYAAAAPAAPPNCPRGSSLKHIHRLASTAGARLTGAMG